MLVFECAIPCVAAGSNSVAPRAGTPPHAPVPVRRVSESNLTSVSRSKEEERYRKARDVVLGEPRPTVTSSPVKLNYTQPTGLYSIAGAPAIAELFYSGGEEADDAQERSRSVPSNRRPSSFRPVAVAGVHSLPQHGMLEPFACYLTVWSM